MLISCDNVTLLPTAGGGLHYCNYYVNTIISCDNVTLLAVVGRRVTLLQLYNDVIQYYTY